jgi:hypothetical protein
MTETERTTVTLSKINMKLVNELIGVYGNTQAAVISNMVKHFFEDSKNYALIEELKARKRKFKPPEEKVIEERISNLLKWADSIPFEDFIKDLDLDRQYVIDHFHKWTKKYNIKRIDNKIIKIE